MRTSASPFNIAAERKPRAPSWELFQELAAEPSLDSNLLELQRVTLSLPSLASLWDYVTKSLIFMYSPGLLVNNYSCSVPTSVWNSTLNKFLALKKIAISC